MTKKLPATFDRTSMAPLFNNSIGFDNIFNNLIDDLVPSTTTVTFPPYNIRKIDDYTRSIEVALAGYSIDDIVVEVEANILSITGDKEDNDHEYHYKGVATRKFRRQFKLTEHSIIESTIFRDGMLEIIISLEEPKKPTIQKIPITT